jgi:hypothetical protein
MIDEPLVEPEDAFATTIREAHAAAERTTREFPYASVAAALGAGVVLGGGLPSWAVRLLLTGGARLAAARWVDAVAQAAEAPAPSRAPSQAAR